MAIRARSGPPPDPNSLRSGEWTTLPAEGRQGPTPEWPLGKASARELSLWRRYWTLPQAVIWEQDNQHDLVALYCRRFVEAEKRGSPTNAATLVRQLADSLGISTPGMRANRWKIGAATSTATPQQRSVPSSRSRLKVVDPVEQV